MSQLIVADSSVLFHFSIKLEDGSVADSTALHGKPARLRMGDGSLTLGGGNDRVDMAVLGSGVQIKPLVVSGGAGVDKLAGAGGFDGLAFWDVGNDNDGGHGVLINLTLDRIVAAIAELDAVIGSIATGASEQSRDLTQVTQAITRLDQMAVDDDHTEIPERLPQHTRRQAA